MTVPPGALDADATRLWRPGHGAVHLGYASTDPAGRVVDLLADALPIDWITTFTTEQHKDWPATWHIDEAERLVRDMQDIMYGRSALRFGEFKPTPENPLVAAVLCDLDLRNPEVEDRAELIVRGGRKLGVALVVVALTSTLDSVGSETIRASLTWLSGEPCKNGS